MKAFFLALIFSCTFSVGYSQNALSNPKQLRKEGKLEAAIEAYKITYAKNPENWKNTYNLACTYALTFQKDSAFYYLEKALKNDNSLWALADTDLFALIDDPHWSTIEENQLQRFQEKNGKIKQPEYTKELLKLISKDQALDYYIDQAKVFYMKEGYIPQWYYPLGEFKKQIAKENFNHFQDLLATYGWPTYSIVGKLAADAPLLIINHHEDGMVRKKYINQIKKACEESEGSCVEFAKIQDRILVDEGKPQMYGMQFRYNSTRKLEPFPIKDPEYVDQRRKEIGLEPLKEYLKRKIDYVWDVTQKNKK